MKHIKRGSDKLMRSEEDIREKLHSIRKQLTESEKNPIQTVQDRRAKNYLVEFNRRDKQRKDELHWIDEIAILEWVLQEESSWKTSWMSINPS